MKTKSLYTHDTLIYLLGSHLKQEQMESVLALSYQSDDEILYKNKKEQINIDIFWYYINFSGVVLSVLIILPAQVHWGKSVLTYYWSTGYTKSLWYNCFCFCQTNYHCLVSSYFYSERIWVLERAVFTFVVCKSKGEKSLINFCNLLRIAMVALVNNKLQSFCQLIKQ